MSEPAWVPLGAAGVVPQGALVTVLPASPVDGQEVILTDSLTAGTYFWCLRYVAARATNKWVFIGGAPIISEVATADTSGSGSYAALATAGPSIALPVAGDYEVALGFQLIMNTGVTNWSSMSFDVGATAAVEADAVWAPNPQVGSPQQRTTHSRIRRKSGLAAVTLTAKYKTQNGNTQTFADRWMRVIPIAVGG